eukprot:869573-Amphidinium_carterae.1
MSSGAARGSGSVKDGLQKNTAIQQYEDQPRRWACDSSRQNTRGKLIGLSWSLPISRKRGSSCRAG